MQTFLPYEDYAASAAVLDMMRLGKQRVETFQVLQRLVGERLITSKVVYETKLVSKSPKGTPRDEMEWEEVEVKRKIPLEKSEWAREPIVSTGWNNHPAVAMWRNHVLELLEYQRAICNEWTSRGYADTCLEKSEYLLEPHRDKLAPGKPKWLGNEEFHKSHRSNLLRKDFNRYASFFPDDDPELPYVWPSKLESEDV